MRRSMSCLAIMLAGVFATACVRAEADGQQRIDDVAIREELGRLVLNVLLSRPTGIETGHYTAIANFSDRSESGLTTRRTSRIVCTFDNGTELLRLESGESDTGSTEVTQQQRQFYVQSPSGCMVYSPEWGELTVAFVTGIESLRPEAFIDLQTVGLLTCDEMRRVASDAFDAEVTANRRVLVRPLDANATLELEVVLEDGRERRVWELDRWSFYAPLRMTRYSRADVGQPWSLVDVTTVKWGDTSGVVVPIEIRTESSTQIDRIVFDWHSVNERLRQEQLGPQSIPLLPGTMITDVLTDPGYPAFVGYMPERSHRTLLQAARGWSLVLGSLVATVLGIGAFVAVRWAKRATAMKRRDGQVRGGLSRLWRRARRTGIACSCAMAVGCLGLMIATVWWRPQCTLYKLESAPDANEFRFRLADSEVDVVFRPVVETISVSAHAGLVTCERDESPYGWAHSEYECGVARTGPAGWKTLSPFAAINATVSGTTQGQDRTAVVIPLFALANVFALWPAIHVWRRWRRSRRQEATA